MKETILVVEDEAKIRSLLTLYLEKNNYRVCTAKDGDEALRKVKENSPALIVLDIMLPKRNGLDVCCTIRSNKRYSEVPILYVSSLHEKQSIISSLDMGGDDYVTKPFDPNEVIARIRCLLRRVRSTFNRKEPDPLYEDLTPQETNILRYISDGFTNKEVANELSLTEGTIKVYNHTIFQKLHVNNRTQAIVRAKELAIL